ncbi:TetR/AcrR family transcriptional regulator [Enterococcus thailandicus]|uniref:HTH tetR-type domain-containing protein n=1 Tax=bioreactor metagenome TaxID=1076179 RepID=A0A645CJH7_9ZZZZ|nr:TetR/AcrR family transcriptional regulator [Enterococcus thailandicus]ASZ07905.1 TetR family transcriptional regulator [Enterococcus thailandicus]MDK4351814.1 TetR/AcrR family transcriptional regulator [Enterococcus thailandicus]MDT2734253.1 TetR/AcrR family transcriptional regulator [Enterococcus thailandicus]MEA4829080.1 TetR/AcrR family transcriptional regulator [Enterococcus thailandicus]
MNNAVSSKEELISYCKEIVKEQGIQAVNIRSLAKKSGISVGAVYNYFPSKSHLLSATIGSIWAEIFHLSETSFDFNNFLDCLAALLRSIEKGKELYPNFFTAHALVMPAEDQAMGSELMETYWNHIKQGMLKALQKDPQVRESVFNQQLSMEEYVDYIFELFLYTIISEKKHENLLQLVRNSIY